MLTDCRHIVIFCYICLLDNLLFVSRGIVLTKCLRKKSLFWILIQNVKKVMISFPKLKNPLTFTELVSQLVKNISCSLHFNVIPPLVGQVASTLPFDLQVSPEVQSDLCAGSSSRIFPPILKWIMRIRSREK